MQEKDKEPQVYFSIREDELFIPIDLLEEVQRRGYCACTNWDSNYSSRKIAKIGKIKDIRLWDKQDIELAICQQELEGK
jgi:hypothetical protein